MALSIVNNALSINAQRNLDKTGQAFAKSLERLSSGLRINRSGDDAAGLAISEGLRSQIRGLSQATRNSNDAISLVSTAEGAIGESTSLLQRLRELAVQAASDTNSTSNRNAIQNEVSSLVSEIDRISTTVEFNGTKLLDGTFTAKQIQVGAFANQTLSVNFFSLRTNTLGQVAESTGTAVTAALSSGDLTLNGVAVGATTSDGVSTIGANGSAIALAAAINAVSGSSNVSAQAQAAVRTASNSAVGATTIDGTTNTLTINGVNIGAVTAIANDADSALRNKINAASNSTGVVASLNSSNQLVLTAADGRNIEIDTTGSIADNLGLAAADGDVTNDTTRGTLKLTSDSAFAVAGAAPAAAGFSATTVSLDATTALNSISVTTRTAATTAIQRIDAALRQLSTNRAQIGATTNRLESTVSSLQIAVENLTSSESRIRDADFAAETAALTRNQILQQAGVAILSQANASPQLALSLLK